MLQDGVVCDITLFDIPERKGTLKSGTKRVLMVLVSSELFVVNSFETWSVGIE